MFSGVGFMTILSKGNDFFIPRSIVLIIDSEEKAWAQISEDKTVGLQSQQGLKIIHHKKKKNKSEKKNNTAVSDHINKRWRTETYPRLDNAIHPSVRQFHDCLGSCEGSVWICCELNANITANFRGF